MPENQRRATNDERRGKSDGERGFSHRDLIVWQKGMMLVSAVYRFSQKFPTDERFGLTSQLRRAAVSVPSNVAEGRSRNSTKDFIQFLHIALGSVSEVETQLEIARDLAFGTASGYAESMGLLEEERKMLIAMIASLKNKDDARQTSSARRSTLAARP